MRPFNFKLDPVTVEALRSLANKHAVSAAAVVRMAVREKAEREFGTSLVPAPRSGRRGGRRGGGASG